MDIGRDIIGLAQTGSGKTAAFSIPILQELWNAPQPFFACIMSPTRYVIISNLLNICIHIIICFFNCQKTYY